MKIIKRDGGDKKLEVQLMINSQKYFAQLRRYNYPNQRLFNKKKNKWKSILMINKVFNFKT